MNKKEKEDLFRAMVLFIYDEDFAVNHPLRRLPPKFCSLRERAFKRNRA